jgi:CHASE2 domain-containing sensor protein
MSETKPGRPLVRFIVLFWVALYSATYALAWVDRHRVTLFIIVGITAAGLIIRSYYTRFRQW